MLTRWYGFQKERGCGGLHFRLFGQEIYSVCVPTRTGPLSRTRPGTAEGRRFPGPLLVNAQDTHVAHRDQLPSGPELHFSSLRSRPNMGQGARRIPHAKMRNQSGLTQRRTSHASKSPRAPVPMLKEEAALARTPAELSALSLSD